MTAALDRRTLLVGIGASIGSGVVAGLAAPALARFDRFPAPTRELMVPVSGGRVYVRINGDLAGPRAPVVFVHGGPGGTHDGYLEALTLADPRQGPPRAVILYDQLDSGRSDRPNDPANWTVARFTDELEAIRTALGVPRWHVCGHSWGGTVALEYGARRPAALAGLVLASPLISTRSWIADADILRTRLPDTVQKTLTACDSPTPPPTAACTAATDAFYRQFNGREPPSPAVLAARQSRQGGGFNPQLYRTMWGASEFVATGTLKEYDGEPLLARLDGPRTLFIVGQYDEARPDTAEAFATRVPGAEFAVVPGASHHLFGDRSDETLGLLRPWLLRHDPRKA
ncbi:proline iminopeptidase-family hydrolase [Sphingomonas mollis]|uniref:Proline iminopeptidase-family hydrolase n=1 Tax=Sphingomonas mollis TaxID=2795726 RepID=A0ABS0XS73_9SPHN|nr:proline iminopeptidase-family hydrolase [Sphingomonas sp. BT553]MBJ6122600.1 proline iminopeptidase-family hydrolase [Sphingomonas sp. BT553]